MEGGGDKGSYEVGALKAFLEFLPKKEIQYDVVTGVSVGAINAISLALHKKGDEEKCINWMNELWLNMQSSDIYSNWPYGYIEGLLYQEGLLNNANGVEFLTKLLKENFPDKKVHRQIEWNAVDINTAEIKRFNENEEWDSIPEKIIASASMPFAFPHMHIGENTYVDGGSVWNVDYASGINRCISDGFKEKNIIVDIILCTGVQDAGEAGYNTIQNYIRMRDIQTYYTSMSDLDEVRRGYENVQFRYLIVPNKPLPSGYIPLGFKKESITEMIRLGYEDAKKVILGEEDSFSKVESFKNDLDATYDPEAVKKFNQSRI
uniref:PNPLA domain-containing protein n=1 Tax=Euplotes crassus TaxID=5936 RepID=A0A7S3KDD3_EUPCR|mmetsp:Transcript_20089/g.19719  ORF Transcript_20089/g.19719 Transcript_20089/m.19719 type:complete len:319 (+) Transcript_20089:150-1106(+)|eukprot:CAMPEP_0197003808 /NCGR_PEP_ID=MMETSP1380-20130617/14285_1 /TAXON_ID=5936 /ORGANISM="Euplotes crassus, Strain CT5" /LENGTH=318 /DNA_ID=CAMNT_0042422411 /DNA_START=125 /DNA_END=1081 /DNA_ORIENTATION=+